MISRILDFIRRSAIPLLVAGAFFMENLDSTVIVTALPTMAREFGQSTTDLSIGVSAYLIAMAVLIPVSGWVSDRFGARRTFAMAILFFTLSSILCACSRNLLFFTIARILQGSAGALMTPVGRLVVLRNAPKSELINAIATITWPGLAAPVLGPPLGGLIVANASWHWIFLLNVPLGIIGLILALRLIPEEHSTSSQRFDLIGFLLSGSTCLLTMIGVEWISQHGVSVAPLILIASGLGTGVITFWHAGITDRPLVDLWALCLPTFAVTVRSGSLFRAVVAALTFLLPLMLQVGFGYSPVRAGFFMLALFAGNLAMKPATTFVLRRFPFRRVLVVNGMITAITFFLCACISPASPDALVLGLFFASGLARSMQFTTFNTLTFADVPAEQMTGANTLFNTAFRLAMGMGVALGATALRLSGWFFHENSAQPTVRDFRLALIAMGVLCLLSLIEMTWIDPTAGDEIRLGSASQS